MTRRSLISVSIVGMLALGLAGCSNPSPTAGTPTPAGTPRPVRLRKRLAPWDSGPLSDSQHQTSSLIPTALLAN